MKRFLPLLAAALALATTLASAQPAAYPSQPIKWIVPYAAGGGTDNLARSLAEAMQPSLGQPLIIDNRPGASTNIGVSVMMQAKPDGYTVMQAENAALLFNEHMFVKLPYKPATDFTYIGTIGRFPVALVVHPDFPAKNVAEFVRYVKANPEKVSYASPGNGSPHHMAMELFKQKAGLSIVHVPYKGAAPAMSDVMGGQVPVMMLDLASGLSIIKSGKVRVLAIALPQRANALPEVPTFVEAGFPDVNAYAFHGLIGPAGMPPEAVARLNAELHKAMKAPKVVKLFADFGFEALPGTPQDFYKLSRAESERWGNIIKTAGVKLD
ncbi:MULTISPECIES: Bug family tripartite tricarboxylate transporter substrate binding protein [Variovorax]|uniref:Bug family tripartite tricarboxylate transporter substrate binding protein n=1 Tax=Variovorax TaxID=34072 RepID=UPI0008699BD2|nr:MULTISPECIES: tripartite tricarboxylate transporter substrate binding protein [Variovorax]MBN8755077.1 tripartite tricarboxylate transporter substrate binding protein [Variovorax sp.]ODU15025.1 MAG: ABC transporter substrate-binding protein [Variovorax sp. SCN 67-85]ODV26342.1 MAG: ABC transporter substrate-binding protein [Variovorax sp. SCN 67-20]OJZ03862.1 MAG: ABC transporter substrate-binding protein [Variovorax sp. 67-131]UKI11990.1 tripartite tricarboxylate transporter substrate bind